MISVIVVNWNRSDLLRGCLQSLAEQRGLGASGCEVIVVDNGSGDGSADMVEREFPHARLIRNGENRGFCAANNQGIAAAGGDFVALLNNDAEAHPDWLAALLRVFDAGPDVGMAASKILVWGEPGRIDKVGHLIYPDGQNRGRGSGELDRGQYDRPEDVLWPDGCAAMYRRSMLGEIGGFDEDFFAYADDAELGLRGRIAGWRCIYTPEAVVWHRRGATLGLASGRRLELIERNRVLLAAKLFPWSLLWLNGAYFAMRIAAGIRASLDGKGETKHYGGIEGKWIMARSILRGDWQALRLIPKMFRKRRDLRKIRRLSGRQTRELLLRHRISLRELSEGPL